MGTGQGRECRSRKTSQEAIAITQALIMVAWTRAVAVDVMRRR